MPYSNSRIGTNQEACYLSHGPSYFATLLVHQGVPITTVQKLLGHTSVRTTEVYSEVLSNTIIRDLKAIKRKKKTPDFSRVVECG